MQPEERSSRPQHGWDARKVRAQAAMQLVMAAEFAARERMTLDARIGKERSTEGTRPQFSHAAPGTAKIGWIEHRVCEHHASVMATQKNFAHQHTRAAALRKHESLIAIRAAQVLEDDLHGYMGTAFRDTRGERTAVYQPGSIAACCNGRRLPVGITGMGCHESCDYRTQRLSASRFMLSKARVCH